MVVSLSFFRFIILFHNENEIVRLPVTEPDGPFPASLPCG